MANEYRAPRIWHIEERFGYWYSTNQFGGFTRHDTRAQAEAAIEADIATYGDTWASIAAPEPAGTPPEPQPAVVDEDEHRLEDHGKIYFSLGPGENTWRLDSASLDGYPLDGLDEIECTYGNRRMCQVCRSAEGRAELDRAGAVPIPTARELLDMLAEHYGYTLVAHLDDTTNAAGDPDQLLAQFRETLREIEQEAADYHANPANENDAQATATYVDRHAELLAEAVDAAVGLDAAASHGVRPQLWNHAHAA
ncbi:hypothetical protein ACFVVM_32600 [Nocardia sp. NPDC058176]|uniref:hypothetical protein n=1 Tax=Nocardia sp. NPDC058176 TaxID=3346368 RepID=UPI0036D93D8E